MNFIRKTIATATVAAGATAVGLVAGAAPANAANIQSGASIMSAPTPYSTLLGGPIGNMPFTMRCWTDGAWANGTNRWFYGNALAYNPRTGRLNMIYGYASAAKVYNQDRVGHC